MKKLLSTLMAASPLLLCGLPAAADVLVNIKGFGDDGSGALIYGYPVASGTVVTLINPVQLTLAAGDYQISDAWGQAGALYDAWNFQATVEGSWAAHYVVAEQGADGSWSVLLDASEAGDPSCQFHFCGWATEQQASDQFRTTAPALLHLDHTAVLGFVTADYALGDNLGGLSLNVHAVSAVPEPASMALLLAGLLGICITRCRRSQ